VPVTDAGITPPPPPPDSGSQGPRDAGALSGALLRHEQRLHRRHQFRRHVRAAGCRRVALLGGRLRRLDFLGRRHIRERNARQQSHVFLESRPPASGRSPDERRINIDSCELVVGW
jgi:hypothetical protein